MKSLARIGSCVILLVSLAGTSFSRAANLSSTNEIIQTIGDLGHAQYAAREAASQRLLKLAETAHQVVLQQCLRVYAQTRDPEVKARLRDAMETIVDRHLFRAPKGYLGVGLNRVNVMGNGQLVIQNRVMPPGSVWVNRVIEDTAAQKAGIQPNDFIIAVDDKKWETGPDGFIQYIQSKSPGEKVKLSLLRDTTTNTVEAVLGELPKAEQEQLYTTEKSREFFENWLADALKQQGSHE